MISLRPWRASGLLTAGRTVGEVEMRKNGTTLDIWLRVDGTPRWFAVNRAEVKAFLASARQRQTFTAHSDQNAEST